MNDEFNVLVYCLFGLLILSAILIMFVGWIGVAAGSGILFSFILLYCIIKSEQNYLKKQGFNVSLNFIFSNMTKSTNELIKDLKEHIEWKKRGGFE